MIIKGLRTPSLLKRQTPARTYKHISTSFCFLFNSSLRWDSRGEEGNLSESADDPTIHYLLIIIHGILYGGVVHTHTCPDSRMHTTNRAASERCWVLCPVDGSLQCTSMSGWSPRLHVWPVCTSSSRLGTETLCVCVCVCVCMSKRGNHRHPWFHTPTWGPAACVDDKTVIRIIKVNCI